MGLRIEISVNNFSGSYSGVDVDAQAFLTATGITDPTISSAIDTLVVDLKSYGIWSKLKAVYPFVGGTAATHKFNLKNPLDTNAAYRLVFNGGWTHSATGALPNGTNAYASTFFSPNFLTPSSGHISYYSRTAAAASASGEIGVYTSNFLFHMHVRYTGDIFYGFVNTAGATAYGNSDSQGLFTATRRSSSDNEAYRNGGSIGTNTDGLGTVTIGNSFDVVLGALNQVGVIGNYSSKQCAFSSIGDGLTGTENANFYSAVQTFQTTLSRAV